MLGPYTDLHHRHSHKQNGTIFSSMGPKIRTSEIVIFDHRDSTHSRYRSEEDGFSRSLVVKLLEELETAPLAHLTPNEHAHLLVLIQTTLEVRDTLCFCSRLLLSALVHRSTNNAVPWTQMDCDTLFPCVLSTFSIVVSGRIRVVHRSMETCLGKPAIESVSAIAIWSGHFTARAKSCCSTLQLLRVMARCAGPMLGHLVYSCGFIHKSQW